MALAEVRMARYGVYNIMKPLFGRKCTVLNWLHISKWQLLSLIFFQARVLVIIRYEVVWIGKSLALKLINRNNSSLKYTCREPSELWSQANWGLCLTQKRTQTCKASWLDFRFCKNFETLWKGSLQNLNGCMNWIGLGDCQLLTNNISIKVIPLFWSLTTHQQYLEKLLSAECRVPSPDLLIQEI